MYVADAATGEVKRKLTETATDPHIDSLQFIRSTGAWRPDGRRFAVATVIDGRAAIRIIDVESVETVRRLRFDEIDEVLHPAWSPNGRSLALAGLSGGASDLYLADVESGKLERLTDDLYADLEPAWSPSRTALAFVTDRFSTDLTTLKTGKYRLALMDVSGHRIWQIAAFDGVPHMPWAEFLAGSGCRPYLHGM